MIENFFSETIFLFSMIIFLFLKIFVIWLIIEINEMRKNSISIDRNIKSRWKIVRFLMEVNHIRKSYIGLVGRNPRIINIIIITKRTAKIPILIVLMLIIEVPSELDVFIEEFTHIVYILFLTAWYKHGFSC